jgi:hypothetical protein
MTSIPDGETVEQEMMDLVVFDASGMTTQLRLEDHRQTPKLQKTKNYITFFITIAQCVIF